MQKYFNKQNSKQIKGRGSIVVAEFTKLEKLNEETYIVREPVIAMVDAPFENDAVDDVRKWIENNTDEKSLAVVYADVFNQTGWLMHDVDEDPSIETIYNAWYKLEQELYAKILRILEEENNNNGAEHVLSGIGKYFIAEQFMNRYGYIASGGWWISEEEYNNT